MEDVPIEQMTEAFNVNEVKIQIMISTFGVAEVKRIIQEANPSENGQFRNIHIPDWHSTDRPDHYDGLEIPFWAPLAGFESCSLVVVQVRPDIGSSRSPEHGVTT
ncbi:hypothetical protein AC579_10055 [Pseudocercospora musae]|uniref:Uncharacterized protein n=1 Tax=Pseudocercospora musae TaxID=113226 RepID=A0A139I6D4_9PEZI|nr:hypothetical protein AC579_10055 [Pseudocercospora musae]